MREIVGVAIVVVALLGVIELLHFMAVPALIFMVWLRHGRQNLSRYAGKNAMLLVVLGGLLGAALGATVFGVIWWIGLSDSPFAKGVALVVVIVLSCWLVDVLGNLIKQHYGKESLQNKG